jgi:hypothetical protein
MRVLVCGGRGFTNQVALWRHLDAFHALDGPITLVIHGGYRGADLLAEKWAIENDVRHLPFKADWTAFGKAAGPMRNRRMLLEGKPDLVIGFPGGDGTENCLAQARELGVQVIQPLG